MDPILLLTIIGSVASLVSLLISKPDKKSKMIHFTYAVILTLLAGGSILFIKNNEINSIHEQNLLNAKVDSLSSSLASYEDFSNNANRIFNQYIYTTNVGDNRGFILTSFAFLEKNKDRFPETYQIAKELIVKGILITKSAPDRDLDEKWNEEKRMKDGAATMKSLLEGLINNKNTLKFGKTSKHIGNEVPQKLGEVIGKSILKHLEQYNYGKKEKSNNHKKSKFIESVLLGMPLTPFLVSEDEKARLEIIDGSQRIRTLIAFYNNEFSIRNLCKSVGIKLG